MTGHCSSNELATHKISFTSFITSTETFAASVEHLSFSVLEWRGVRLDRSVPLPLQLLLRFARYAATRAGYNVQIPLLDAPAPSIPRPLSSKVPPAGVVVSLQYRELHDAHVRWRKRNIMHYEVDVRPFDARVRVVSASELDDPTG